MIATEPSQEQSWLAKLKIKYIYIWNIFSFSFSFFVPFLTFSRQIFQCILRRTGGRIKGGLLLQEKGTQWRTKQSQRGRRDVEAKVTCHSWQHIPESLRAPTPEWEGSCCACHHQGTRHSDNVSYRERRKRQKDRLWSLNSEWLSLSCLFPFDSLECSDQLTRISGPRRTIWNKTQSEREGWW